MGNDNAVKPQATRETKRVMRDARTGLIEKTITDIRNVGPEICVERVLIAADGGVTVSLTDFAGLASFTRQQLGELIGRVASLTWLEAGRVAKAKSEATP